MCSKVEAFSLPKLQIFSCICSTQFSSKIKVLCSDDGEYTSHLFKELLQTWYFVSKVMSFHSITKWGSRKKKLLSTWCCSLLFSNLLCLLGFDVRLSLLLSISLTISSSLHSNSPFLCFWSKTHLFQSLSSYINLMLSIF